MSVTLRGATGLVEVHWWWEAPHEGRRAVPLGDRTRARALLGRLGERPDNLAALRRFAREHLANASTRVEDTALLDQVAWWVVGGRVRVAAQPPVLHGLYVAEQEAAPAKEVAWDAPPPESAPAVEPPTFGTDIDGPAIAAAMRQAAQDGVPFCEQCLRKKLARERAAAAAAPAEPATLSPTVDAAAQAATLRDAAQRGTPFCAECEKAKAARAAGGNPQ